MMGNDRLRCSRFRTENIENPSGAHLKARLHGPNVKARLHRAIGGDAAPVSDVVTHRGCGDRFIHAIIPLSQ